MLPPSVETKTSVFSCVEPAKAEAISSIAAVDAIVEAAPVPSRTSRWAITATCRSEGPGRIPIRFRSSTSSPSWSPLKRCSETSIELISLKRASTASAMPSS